MSHPSQSRQPEAPLTRLVNSVNQRGREAKELRCFIQANMRRHIYIHTYIYTFIHILICTLTHSHFCWAQPPVSYTPQVFITYIHITYTRMYRQTCVCVCVCVCICVYVCVYVDGCGRAPKAKPWNHFVSLLWSFYTYLDKKFFRKLPQR